MVISHSYVSHYQRVIFRSDRTWPTRWPQIRQVSKSRSHHQAQKRWKGAPLICAAIWNLAHFLCESVWCSLCRCQLSFVHFPIFPALYGKCSRRSHWRMHVYLLKRRCMIGTYIGTIGKDPFNLFLSAVQLALGCTTGMRQWQWDGGGKPSFRGEDRHVR